MHYGILSILPSKRYGFHDSGELIELCSGEVVEVEIDGKWEQTRVEFSHKAKDYIFINGYQIEGAKVRVNF